MKKQFFRVKQLADQTFSRAGKTELLSDDLQEADRHVEFLRQACTNTNKKLGACLLGLGADDAAREKRLRKCPEYLLGHAMQECSTCDENFLLRHVLARCGSVEVALANELVELDMRVEQGVVNPLQAILDMEVPSILKHKRNLAKLTLDMDSARTRYQQAVKHNAPNVTGLAKIDAVREEMEDAESKVEQCRDVLASEMFQLISRETELAKLVAHYVNLQKSYHEKALQFLEKMIPDLETYINDSDVKPVFGFPLEEHLRVTGRKIALPVELCVCALLELGMEEEGLFRVAGGASKVRRMRMSLDASCLSLQTALEYSDPHVIAGVLKSYLRELPEPLLTHKLYEDWMAAARLQGPNEIRLKALNEMVQRLPEANRENLRYLIKFLALLTSNQNVNKMTPQNIAIVIAPNLMWSPADENNVLGMNMSTANIHSFIVDNLVTFADYFFPQEIEFYLTFAKSEPIVDLHHIPAGHRGSMYNGMIGSIDRGHTRSSSGDTMLISTSSDSSIKRTQSNSSLTDQSSPPHSPKPVTRRKNKVAPHPPPVSSKQEGPERPDKPPRPVTMCMTPGRPPPKDKIESSPVMGPPRDKPEPVVIPETKPKLINIEKFEQSSSTVIQKEKIETIPPPEIKPKPVKDAHRKSLDLSLIDSDQRDLQKNDVVLRQQFPTPAPRSIIPKDASQDSLDSDKTANVGDERPKPAIPERPASLRHGSFRVKSEDRDATVINDKNAEPTPSKGAMLERIHMYSVDKQQVSIVQVSSDKTVVMSNEGNEPTNSSSRPSSVQEKRNSFEKPERPPKPDLISLSGDKTGQVQATSDSTDEDLADTDKTGSTKSGAQPSSPRGHPSRPPRPQPPPPPPPVKRGPGGAPVSESTDL